MEVFPSDESGKEQAPSRIWRRKGNNEREGAGEKMFPFAIPDLPAHLWFCKQTLATWCEDFWLIGKNPDAGKNWGQEEKGATEDGVVGWHHWLNGHEFKQTQGDSNGQRSLACYSSVQFSRSVVSDSLWPHEPQYARPSCPSLTPGVHPNWCPLSQWCHPTILSSVVPFSSCLWSFPASGSSN